MSVLIRLKSLGKKFRKRVILNKISLDIYAGEIFGIIGMSGSGKTTFLNSLMGYLEPDVGDIFYYSFTDKNYKSIFSNWMEVRRLFGFATQTHTFYPKLTLAENLDHFGSLYHLSPRTRKINAGRLLQLTGLYHFKDELAQNLSEGMKKRLGIACALIHNPKVLLLDEPTADLDPVLRKEMWNLIKGIHKMGTTIIVASHFLEELEDVCDRIGILHNAQIIHVGTPDQLRQAYSKNEEVYITTHPGRYDLIANSLRSYPQLPIKRMMVKDHKLVVHTLRSEATLHYILHIIERMNEKIINMEVKKPSLDEIFEIISRRR